MEQNFEKQILPNHLQRYRAEAGLYQSDVAFLLDMKNATRISEWERGLSHPSLEHLISLSIIYQRLPDQLYYELRKMLAAKIAQRLELLRAMKEKKKIDTS